MFRNFLWTKNSTSRNQLTERYEPVQPYLFLEMIKLCRCTKVFDIGANIGAYSVFAASLESVDVVYSYEAAPMSYSELSNNIKLNNFENKVKCQQFAVSNEDGDVSFMIASELSGINCIKGATFHNEGLYSDEISVPAVTLDSSHKMVNERLAFKIDVEGNEEAVLQGAEALLTNNQCFIQLEDYQTDNRDIDLFLEKLGYESFLQVKNDKYYCKKETSFDLNKYREFISHTLSSLVSNSLKSYVGYSVHDNISGEAFREGSKTNVAISVKDHFFNGEVEYALYLHIDGKREAVYWYQDSPIFEVNLGEGIDIHRVALSLFARQKDFSDKKLSRKFKLSNLLKK